MSKEVTNESKTLNLTAADLKELLASAVQAAVAEAKKPFISEQDKANIEQAQEQRRGQAAQTLAAMAFKKQSQLICSHKHAKSGDSHCVYITNAGYILCQKCQAKIRPEVAPEEYTGSDIYSVELFNQVFQEIGNNELIG